MVENDQAVVKPYLTIRQFQIIDCAAAESWFDEIFQIITPVAKTASEGEGQVHFIEQFVAEHEAFQQTPGIAKLNLVIDRCLQFASRARGSKSQEWPGGDKRVTGFR